MSAFLRAPRRPAAIPGGVTHVLAWLPGYLTDDGEGWWQLHSAAGWYAGEPQGESYPCLDAPRDCDPMALRIWAQDVLGIRRLSAEAFTARIRLPGRPWSRREPAYLIRQEPAEGGSISVTFVADEATAVHERGARYADGKENRR